MYVHISHPELLRTLRDFLEREDCIATEFRPDHLDVQLPRATSEAQAHRELDVYLATWQVMNPGIETYIIDRDDGA